MRCLLVLPPPPGEAELVRAALLEACRAHAAAGAPGELRVALLPVAGAAEWLPASALLGAAPPPPAQLVASVRALIASAPAHASLELTWLLPPGGLVPLRPGGPPPADGGSESYDPVGLAAYFAMQSAAQRGMRRSCTLVRPALAACRPSAQALEQWALGSDQWAALLQPSDLLEREAAAPPEAAAALAAHFDGGRHWAGTLQLHGSALAGLCLGPLPASLPCDEAGAGAGRRRCTSDMAPRAEPAEAPAPGSAMELVRPLREEQLPPHLRLRHVWLLSAAPGERAQPAAHFLSGWARACDHEATGAGGAGAGAGANALLVRCTAPPSATGGAASTLLLLYGRGGQMRAQLCAPADSIAGAIRFLQLQPDEPAAAASASAAPAWRRALPLERATTLLEHLGGGGGPEHKQRRREGPCCSHEELWALRVLRYDTAGMARAAAAAAPPGGEPAAGAAASSSMAPAPLTGRGGPGGDRAPTRREAAPGTGLPSATAPPFGLSSRDVLRALRRVKQGGGAATAAEEADWAAAGLGGDVAAAAPPPPDPAAAYAEYEPPKAHEHLSLLCMLEPTRLELASCATHRPRPPGASAAPGGGAAAAAAEPAAEPAAESAAHSTQLVVVEDPPLPAAAAGQQLTELPSDPNVPSSTTSIGSDLVASAAALVHKAAKSALKALLAPLIEGVDARGGDWTSELAQLERRVMGRLERGRLLEGLGETARAEAVARAAKAELLEVVRGGLNAAHGHAGAAAAHGGCGADAAPARGKLAAAPAPGPARPSKSQRRK